MANPFSHFARVEFAPPDYIALPTAGIDISASGIKTVMLKEHLKRSLSLRRGTT
jgi:hypothetical protein